MTAKKPKGFSVGVELSLDEILRATRGKALGKYNPAISVGRISTDTRLLEKKDVFFALIGKRFDGHSFISEAMEKGVQVFVVSDLGKIKPEQLMSAVFIQVEDTLVAYGDLARYFRQKFKIPVVAVTGSSGKTTVKELIAHLLSSKFKVLKNRGTENNLIGVPKTLFQLDAGTQVVVLELGTNLPGEIERLSSIARPQVGVLTQIGYSHLEGLKDLAGVREEKLKILKHLERGGLLIVNGEDGQLADVQSGVHRVVRAGLEGRRAEVVADHLRSHPSGTTFTLNGRDKMETALFGRHNVLNCLLAIQTAMALGVEPDAIQKSLPGFKPVPGRLSLKVLDEIQFLDDSYNSNPTSFQAALETLKSFKVRGKKGVVCGDMLELGAQAEIFHRQAGRSLKKFLFDFVVAAGPLSAHLVEEAVQAGYPAAKIFHAPDSAQAGKICQKLATAGDLVLVKGSRGMQMEKVWQSFESPIIIQRTA